MVTLQIRSLPGSCGYRRLRHFVVLHTIYDMAYQYKRESLTQEEASRLANACSTGEEHLVVWTLLDTGLRVGEFSSLTRDQVDWQAHRLMVYGKGGPYSAMGGFGRVFDLIEAGAAGLLDEIRRTKLTKPTKPTKP